MYDLIGLTSGKRGFYTENGVLCYSLMGVRILEIFPDHPGALIDYKRENIRNSRRPWQVAHRIVNELASRVHYTSAWMVARCGEDVFLLAPEVMIVVRRGEVIGVKYIGDKFELHGKKYIYNFDVSYAHVNHNPSYHEMGCVMNELLVVVRGHPDFYTDGKNIRLYAVNARPLVHVSKSGNIRIEDYFAKGACRVESLEYARDYLCRLMLAFNPPLAHSEKKTHRNPDIIAYRHLMIYMGQILIPGDKYCNGKKVYSFDEFNGNA